MVTQDGGRLNAAAAPGSCSHHSQEGPGCLGRIRVPRPPPSDCRTATPPLPPSSQLVSVAPAQLTVSKRAGAPNRHPSRGSGTGGPPAAGIGVSTPGQKASAAVFSSWRERGLGSALPELCSFITGLDRDTKAVEAALALPWSNGPVEGQEGWR